MDAAATRMDEAEQRISNTEDKLIENNEEEKKREIKAKEHNLRIREIIKKEQHQNHRGPRRGREREIGVEALSEPIIAENFPNLGKDTDIKSRKHRGPPLDSTKTNHQQGIS